MSLAKQPISMPIGTVVHLSNFGKVRCGIKDSEKELLITKAYVTPEGRLEYAANGCDGYSPNELTFVREANVESVALALILAGNFESDDDQG